MQLMMMGKKQKQKSKVRSRAWNLLRLALLWARKGGMLKNRLFMDLRLVPKYLKSLGHANPHHHQRGALHYGDRELSFDETPIIHFKMHRPTSLRFKMPNIPCIKPPAVDFDYDYDFDLHHDHRDHYKAIEEVSYVDDDVVARRSFLKTAADDESTDGYDDDDDDETETETDDEMSCEECDQVSNYNYDPCDDEIDLKAEKFIANFYEQMKLQRQISYLQ